uniref:Uncharacterized protein n=1 Tax=Oryza glumipatula TaxID=40148 RepID=A0A0D9ZRF4_9ORYZ
MHTAALHSQAAAAATSSSSPPLPAMTRIPNARDGGDPLDTEEAYALDSGAAATSEAKIRSRWRRRAVSSSSSSAMEIGDFENWMKIMDFDCKSINAAVPNIYQS